MKTKNLLRGIAITGILSVFSLIAKGQGLETFNNLNIAGTAYVDGSFTGNNQITWSYVQCTGEQIYPIDGKGILLRRSSPQSKITSSPIPGGIGSFSVQMRKAFTGTGDRQVELFVNGVSKGKSQVFGSASGADATVHTFTVNDINVLGDVVIEIRHITGGTSNRQLVLDNITWTGFSPEHNLEPVITNVTQNPTRFFQPTTSVAVSANVTDQDGTVALVQLRWGQLPDLLNNTIPMVLQGGSTYVTQQNIPAMPSGTTIYYQVYAEDNEEAGALSSIRSYSIDPSYFSLETFETGLGSLIARNVSGTGKGWVYDSQTKTAQMNGGDSEDIEEDWLIVPSINMRTNKLLLDFDTWRMDGSDDYENYFKVYYSTNYPGSGDPNQYVWTEINCTLPENDNVWVNSGLIDLTTINFANVHIAFKYYYTPGNFTNWRVDNIRFRRRSFSVTFNVTNNSLPVAEALVQFNSRIQRTNASGQTVFTQVEPAQNMPFTVSKAGFHPVQGTQTVTSVNASRSVAILNDKIAINVVANPASFEAVISWTGSGAEMYGISYYDVATKNQSYVNVPAGPATIVVGPAAQYGVRVRSMINGVWSIYSPTVFFTTGPGTPVVARNVTVTNITATTAQVNWEGEGAEAYGVYYYTTGFSRHIVTLASPLVIPVSPSTSYQVRIRTMQDGVWSAYTNPIAFATPGAKSNEAFDFEAAGSISLYPNPASGYVMLNVELTEVSDIKYTIYDIKGSVVKAQQHSNMFGIFEERIELDGLAKGVYFIKVNVPSKTETLRLIVQ